MTRKLYVVANRNSKSSFVEEGEAPSNAFTAVPGFDPAVIWGTSANPSTNWDGKKIFDKPTVMAEVGGTRLWVVTFPPDSVMAASDFDPQAAGAEYGKRLPGLAERFEAENPGMHGLTPWTTTLSSMGKSLSKSTGESRACSSRETSLCNMVRVMRGEIIRTNPLH
jgi:hypothetical protein